VPSSYIELDLLEGEDPLDDELWPLIGIPMLKGVSSFLAC